MKQSEIREMVEKVHAAIGRKYEEILAEKKEDHEIEQKYLPEGEEPKEFSMTVEDLCSGTSAVTVQAVRCTKHKDPNWGHYFKTKDLTDKYAHSKRLYEKKDPEVKESHFGLLTIAVNANQNMTFRNVRIEIDEGSVQMEGAWNEGCVDLFMITNKDYLVIEYGSEAIANGMCDAVKESFF